MHPGSSISVIVPAFQEEKRIGITIEALSAYLETHYAGAELIVVCDGCTDGTASVARQSFNAPSCTLKVIEVFPNQGKGNAVKTGILEASGEYLFFTDADLSFAPETMEPFLAKLQEGAQVVIAQRKKETTYPSFGRRALAEVSRFLVGNFVLPGIRDSQAGYKSFTREAGRDLFSRLRTSRFLFDLEILVMARQKKYQIDKVYVDWEDRPGSTVRIFMDSMRSARDLLLIVWRSKTGQYN